MTFEEAAGFRMGVATASMSLFSELRVPISLEQLREQSGENQVKAEDRDFVLVAGGSMATGTRAIQLLKL